MGSGAARAPGTACAKSFYFFFFRKRRRLPSCPEHRVPARPITASKSCRVQGRALAFQPGVLSTALCGSGPSLGTGARGRPGGLVRVARLCRRAGVQARRPPSPHREAALSGGEPASQRGRRAAALRPDAPARRGGPCRLAGTAPDDAGLVLSGQVGRDAQTHGRIRRQDTAGAASPRLALAGAGARPARGGAPAPCVAGRAGPPSPSPCPAAGPGSAQPVPVRQGRSPGPGRAVPRPRTPRSSAPRVARPGGEMVPISAVEDLAAGVWPEGPVRRGGAARPPEGRAQHAAGRAGRRHPGGGADQSAPAAA